MKKRYSIIILFFVVAVLGIFFYKTKRAKEMEKSLIYYKIIEFENDKNLKKLMNISEFKEKSREDYLLRGIAEYYNKNIENSYELLLKAQKELRKNDIIYNVYLKFFLNNCENILEESGSIERAKYIMEHIGKISELKNNTEFIWRVLVTIISDEDSREISIKMIEKYLKETKGLKKVTKIELKSFIAIYKMLNEDYVESIHLFYDIILKSEKIRDIKERNRLKIKAYEYLANMNFILENYKDAIKQYNMIINIPIEDSDENSMIKYGAYINRTSSYIELRDYKAARESSDETQKIISFVDKDVEEGIKIFFYNNLARIEICEGNLKKAEKYLDDCKILLRNNRNNGFFDADIHIKLTLSELYIAEKKYEEALELLDESLIINNENKLGFREVIYLLQMEVYKQTDRFKEYFKVYDEYTEYTKEKNLVLKKGYLKFVKSSFEENQLKEKEKDTTLKINLLICTVCFVLFGALFQALRVIKIKENNMVDQLTNIYNRKYLDIVYKNLEKNKNYSIGILMFDIDYFKKYNDNYGHLKGDIVIKTVAKILKDSIGKDDSVVRYGGEEFLIILKNSNKDYLKEVYEKIYNKLEEENIIHERSLVSNHITISAGGIVGVVNNKRTFLNLLKKSDEALYTAKREGRNRLVFF